MLSSIFRPVSTADSGAVPLPVSPSDSPEVRLELTWPGKDKFLLSPSDDEGRPVWVERDHPAASEVRLATVTGSHGETDPDDVFGENLLFTGDSLDVLRILRDTPEYADHYRGKIRLAYWDPPFNTRQNFQHFGDSMEHSTWLSFMRERLIIARDLLADDGSIWIHLDDTEVHRMRCLLDEAFGEANFVATMLWQRRFSRQNDGVVSVSHDYILVYRHSLRPRWNRLPGGSELEARYSNPDGDPRGPWQSVGFSAPGERRNCQYEIVGPSGKKHLPPPGRHWATTKDKYDEMVARGAIYFGKDGNGVPRVKKYLADADLTVVPRTWWSYTEVGNTQESVREIQALFPKSAHFVTPKPERLLERVIHIASDPGDIVLDVFAGSGTTAAVAHKMGRRWVTAEINPATVEAFTRARLQKVVDGDDPGGITEKHKWAGGGGFVDVRVGPSMYEVTPAGVLLAEWATNGDFARAVAAQLGFRFQPGAAPLCGVRGRMRLAVFDGAVGPEEIREAVGALAGGERVTVVGKAVLSGAEEALSGLSRGSRVLKAPRDLLGRPR